MRRQCDGTYAIGFDDSLLATYVHCWTYVLYVMMSQIERKERSKKKAGAQVFVQTLKRQEDKYHFMSGERVLHISLLPLSVGHCSYSSSNGGPYSKYLAGLLHSLESSQHNNVK